MLCYLRNVCSDKIAAKLICIYFHYYRSIIKKSTALEYKLHRLIVNKEDFIAYIQVECLNHETSVHPGFETKK